MSQLPTISPRAWLQVWLVVCLLGLAFVARAQPDIDGHPDSSAFYLIPPDTDDWTRHFHIGGFAGFNISGKFNMNGTFGVSGNNPAKGIFDNGYIHPDKSTANDGLTTDWGYNNSSQVKGSMLTMSAASGYTASEKANADVGPSPGFDLAYGDNYWYWKHARVGWELGFDLFPIKLSDSHKIMNASATESSYTFNTGNPNLPGAPYQGNANGNGGVLINYPQSFTPTSTTTNSGSISGSRTLDAIIYSVRLGPTFEWDLGPHVGMSLSAGPALGIISGRYSFDETLNVNGAESRNTGSFDNIGIQYGGYFNATFMYHINESVDLYLGAQYMGMDDYHISGAGRSASLDLSGQVYISAGINWPF